jgi:hypothetical protein
MAKRNRTSIACARCKSAKSKCSDYRPCKQCKTLKLNCDKFVGIADINAAASLDVKHETRSIQGFDKTNSSADETWKVKDDVTQIQQIKNVGGLSLDAPRTLPVAIPSMQFGQSLTHQTLVNLHTVQAPMQSSFQPSFIPQAPHPAMGYVNFFQPNVSGPSLTAGFPSPHSLAPWPTFALPPLYSRALPASPAHLPPAVASLLSGYPPVAPAGQLEALRFLLSLPSSPQHATATFQRM